MAGSILVDYAASQAMAVTNLHSLDNDTTNLIGWSSASVNNTSDEYADFLVSATFTTHASNKAASGFIYVYVVAALNDTPTWPAAATGTWGTQAAASFTDTEERDGFARLLTVLATDATASQIVGFPPTGIAQLFGGFVPPYWALFVTTNCTSATNDALAAAGSAVYYTPVAYRYT